MLISSILRINSHYLSLSSVPLHLSEIKKTKCTFSYRWAYDARVWLYSPLHEKLPNLCHDDNRSIEDSYHILGDSTYPLSDFLITPYRGRANVLPAYKRKFNHHHALKRSCVERSFALLIIRFPRLLKLLCKSDDKRIMCVVAACFLCNWCLIEDDDDTSIFEVVEKLEMNGHVGMPASVALGRRQANGIGTHKRDLLCEIISNLP